MTAHNLDASVIRGEKLVPAAIWIKRTFAVTLMLVSLAGTYVWMNDGIWTWPASDTAVQALIFAIGYQAVVSFAQFALRAQWQSVWYAGAIAASVIPSVLAYGERYQAVWAARIAEAVPGGIAGPLAWLLLAILLVLADIIPEQILVKR